MNENIEESTQQDINILDLLIALGQEKWTLIIVTFVAALLGIIVSLVTPATFEAKASVMTSQQSVGGVGLSALGGLAGLGGLSNFESSMRSSDELHMALMRSRSVQLALIEQLKLQERYETINIEATIPILVQNISFVADKKSGLLYILAQDKDPEFAALLANAQVKELNLILSKLAITEAQQKRLYFEQQISKAQAKIPQLESEYKEAQEKSGIEVVSFLSAAGSLPGQIASKELQLQVLSAFATKQNPEIKYLASEISALRSQMAKYELSRNNEQMLNQVNSGKQNKNSKTDFIQKATQAYTTLKIQEALLDGFVKQLEVAKLDEAKEGPSLQVVDMATAPDLRVKPKRKKIVFAYTLTGFFVALVLAATSALFRYIKSTPEGLEALLKLKRAWGFS